MRGGASDRDENNNLGRMRLSITNAKDATADPLPAAVREVLAIPSEQRTPEQTATVFSYWRTTVPKWRKTNEEIAALWKEYPEGTSQLVLAAQDVPRETHVSDARRLSEAGEASGTGCACFPESAADGRRPDRLGICEMDGGPQTLRPRRVLCESVLAGRISAPALSAPAKIWARRRDRLRIRSCSIGWRWSSWISGWDMKAMHRLIVTSATYRQSSNVTPELYDKRSV